MKYLIMLTLTTCAYTFSIAQQKPNVSEIASIKKPVSIDPLYLLSDGENTKEISKSEFDHLNKHQIEYVKVLNDPALISMYGDKGKNGVVLVVMKGTSGGRKHKVKQG